MTIRRARREDLGSIVEIYRLDGLRGARELTAAPDGTPPEVYAEAFARIDADPANRLFVAEESGRVTGTAQVTVMQNVIGRGLRRALVEAVFVHPDFQGRGIGAALMEATIRFAREQGCRTVELTSNKARTDAHRFYLRLGFEASHEGFKLVLK